MPPLPIVVVVVPVRRGCEHIRTATSATGGDVLLLVPHMGHASGPPTVILGRGYPLALAYHRWSTCATAASVAGFAQPACLLGWLHCATVTIPCGSSAAPLSHQPLAPVLETGRARMMALHDVGHIAVSLATSAVPSHSATNGPVSGSSPVSEPVTTATTAAAGRSSPGGAGAARPVPL